MVTVDYCTVFVLMLSTWKQIKALQLKHCFSRTRFGSLITKITWKLHLVSTCQPFRFNGLVHKYDLLITRFTKPFSHQKPLKTVIFNTYPTTGSCTKFVWKCPEEILETSILSILRYECLQWRKWVSLPLGWLIHPLPPLFLFFKKLFKVKLVWGRKKN